MMKKNFVVGALLFLFALTALGLTGCDSAQENSAELNTETSDIGLDTSDMFSDRDMEVGYTDYVTVNLSDDGCTADSDLVAIDGSSITLSEEGTYLIQGSLSAGQLIVDVPDDAKLQIVLAGADITCADSAPIYIKNGDKVFITLAAESENQLSVSGDYVQTDDNTVDAAIFAKSDLTINGSGTLNINAAYGHGIVSKDDLAFTGGNLVITAAGHGLAGKNSVRIASGTFHITSGKDGIHAENNDDTSLGFIYIADGDFTISAQSDGIDAKNILQVDNGSFNITAGEGSASVSAARQENPGDWGNWSNWDELPQRNSANTDGWQRQNPGSGMAPQADGSMIQPQTPVQEGEQTTTDDTSDISIKGIKASADLVIKGGDFQVDATDDAMHSNANIYLLGGEFNLASGDDGMHADAATVIADGDILISACYEGIEGSSIDISGGSINITADDDGLNAAGGADSSGAGGPGQDKFSAGSADYLINISGGEMQINADGDGIDSNGDLTVSGGSITVFGPTNSANSALDYMGQGTISGGTVIALGASGMAVNFSDSSSQGSILYNLASVQAAGTAVTLIDSNSNEIISVSAEKEYQSVVISSPDISNGETFTLVCGEQSQTIEMTDTLYSNGSQGMGGGNRQQQMPGQNSGGTSEQPTTSNNATT